MDAKKLVLVVGIVFVGFWLWSDPTGFADTTQSAGGATWEFTQDLFSRVIRFFGAL